MSATLKASLPRNGQLLRLQWRSLSPPSATVKLRTSQIHARATDAEFDDRS
jgi:hypothetical protein